MNKKKLALIVLLGAAFIQAKSQAVISGVLINPNGSDTNQEYVQLLATEDIDFAAKNFALVIARNGTTTAPNPGMPAEKGWATGGDRTYKININQGSVKKGELFYVGANKNINGAKSTDISSAKWVANKKYANENGDDFGNKTNSIFPNTGRAVGIALFPTKEVSATTVPVDVVFFQTTGGGVLWEDGKGYLICDNDLYSTKQSPYFRGNGKNKASFENAEAEDLTSYFTQLGGVYDASAKKWTKARSKTWITLSENSQLKDIEADATKLK